MKEITPDGQQAVPTPHTGDWRTDSQGHRDVCSLFSQQTALQLPGPMWVRNPGWRSEDGPVPETRESNNHGRDFSESVHLGKPELTNSLIILTGDFSLDRSPQIKRLLPQAPFH